VVAAVCRPSGVGSPFQALVPAMLVAIAVGAGIAVAAGENLGNPYIVLLLMFAGVLAQRGRIRVMAGVEQSLALLPAICAAVLFGPLAAMAVGGVSMLAEIRGPILKTLTYSGGRALNGLAMGGVALAVEAVIPNAELKIGIAAIAVALTAQVLDVGFAALVFRLRGNAAFDVLKGLLPLVCIAVPIFATTVALLALAYGAVSSWTLPMFLVPALGMHQLFVLYQDQRAVASELVLANQRLRASSLSFASALVSALDARDAYTAGHSGSVAKHARDVAIVLGLKDELCDVAYQAGLVHDIGKLSLPPGLLEKPGSLTADERIVMETHSAAGSEILIRIEGFEEIATYVRHHHERIDGLGYPDQLAGRDIPLISRILAVADAYDAMTSNRPYRDAMPSGEALRRLTTGSGTQFDPDVVDALAKALEITPKFDAVDFDKRRNLSVLGLVS
jgi:HD-GYP domain-containing protein (c-di-GMP phosphodiesterase class II)